MKRTFHASWNWLAAPGLFGFGGSRASAGGGGPAPEGAPENTTPPALTGSGVAGGEMTCSTGVWTHSPTSYAYQWYLNGDMVGDGSSTFTPPETAIGRSLECAVAATNAFGSTGADSNAIEVTSPYSNTAFLKPSAGNDGTAQLNDPNLPYLTADAALAALRDVGLVPLTLVIQDNDLYGDINISDDWEDWPVQDNLTIIGAKSSGNINIFGSIHLLSSFPSDLTLQNIYASGVVYTTNGQADPPQPRLRGIDYAYLGNVTANGAAGSAGNHGSNGDYGTVGSQGETGTYGDPGGPGGPGETVYVQGVGGEAGGGGYAGLPGQVYGSLIINHLESLGGTGGNGGNGGAGGSCTGGQGGQGGDSSNDYGGVGGPGGDAHAEGGDGGHGGPGGGGGTWGVQPTATVNSGTYTAGAGGGYGLGGNNGVANAGTGGPGGSGFLGTNGDGGSGNGYNNAGTDGTQGTDGGDGGTYALP